ncbi:sensor histidine kinase [Gordonia insulae]|uniref:Putative sensor histidine kinase NarS n=1 Tax=Gordonia insulae TaxID=2420509 RepID=A0A3G8JPP1_9ACTN|nr:ATP-binding protein [Gordonia insulae]AZG46948.1 putative sensor histidine kinase NarS [Gordonia insulae]
MASSSSPAPLLGLAELADEQRIDTILIDHALQGIRIQVLLRLLLSVFVLLSVSLEPPVYNAPICIAIAAAYVAWCVLGVILAPRAGILAIRFSWLTLFVDLLVLVAVTAVASESDQISWTADVLVTGFALVPMIAAISMRPMVCAAVVAPTVVVYFVANVIARVPNGRPWTVIALSTFVIAVLALGAVLLSRLQRSRVVTIGSLAAERSRLLDDVMQIEHRERRDLAEHLHDGALQYVLGARQELAGLADASPDPEVVQRIDEALRESARLLRSTLGELHPAVLEQAGLAVALTDLADSIERRGAFSISVDTVGWPDNLRTTVDPVLFAAARELLTNVVKHAQATSVQLTAEVDEGRGRVVVVDDGIGVDPEQLTGRVAGGHIGLASRRVRLEGQGGTLTIAPHPAGGTVAIAEVPVPQPKL